MGIGGPGETAGARATDGQPGDLHWGPGRLPMPMPMRAANDFPLSRNTRNAPLDELGPRHDTVYLSATRYLLQMPPWDGGESNGVTESINNNTLEGEREKRIHVGIVRRTMKSPKTFVSRCQKHSAHI